MHIAWLRAALGADPRTPATSAPSAASACASPGRGNRRRLRLRRFASMLPALEERTDDARRRPLPLAQPLGRGATAAFRVRARPVIGRWERAVPLLPREHGREHEFVRPLGLDSARPAPLAVPVGVALAVARLGEGAAAAANADVRALIARAFSPVGS